MSTRTSTRGLATVIRDLAAVAAGLFGLVHQELTGHVNLVLAGIYAALLGVPGVGGLVSIHRDTQDETMQSPPSPSPAPSSSSPPS